MERRVLVVDDEEAIVEGLMMLFDYERLESAGAACRESALAILQEKDFPVIVTDLRLRTEDDGMMLVEDIRRMSPRSRIVMITAHGTPAIEEEARERGVSAFLAKPASNEDVMHAVNELLAEIEAHAAAQAAPDFEQLYLTARKLLHSIAIRKYGLTADEAEDVVHDAWLLFLQKRNLVQSARAWLSGTVTNLCRQHIDRVRRGRADPIDSAETVAVTTARDATEILTAQQALSRIDERGRTLCRLIAIEGHSYDEVSAATGLPLGSIGPMYLRAKESLRKAVGHSS